jgi:hypothetical protein
MVCPRSDRDGRRAAAGDPAPQAVKGRLYRRHGFDRRPLRFRKSQPLRGDKWAAISFTKTSAL